MKLFNIGTIRAYCNSLRSLMDYFVSNKILGIADMENIHAMQAQCKLWCRNLNNASKQREFEKIYEDFDRIASPDKVQVFFKSKSSLASIRLIEEFSDSKCTRRALQTEYTSTRDFLYIHLSVDNGARPGPLCDLTLKQFSEAREERIADDSGAEKVYRVINIFVHKTSTTHGPARVAFSSVLYR